MTARLQPVTFTSGDGETSVPSYLATPERDGRHPVVLILRGVAGPDDGFTFYDGARHGFAVRTHPGCAEDAAKQSFEAARRFLTTHLTRGAGPTAKERAYVLGS